MSSRRLAVCRAFTLVGLWVATSSSLEAGEKEDLLAACKRASQFDQKGDYQAAAREYETALELAAGVYGNDDPHTAIILNNLANDYLRLRQFAKSEPLYKSSLKIRQEKLGADDPLVGETLHNLAVLYRSSDRGAQAEPLYRRSLEIAEARHGPDHLEVADLLDSLAVLDCELGRHVEAEPLFKRSLQIREAKLGADDPIVSRSLNNLANLYQETGRYALAEPLFKRSLTIKEVRLGKDSFEVAQTLCNLANLYCLMRRYDEAEPLYERSNKTLEAIVGSDHPGLAQNLLNTANMYLAAEKFDRGLPLAGRSLKILEKHLPPDHLMVAAALDGLADFYASMGQPEQAAPLYRRCLAIRDAKLPADHPEINLCISQLASAYRASGQLAEAEPLYQRMFKARKAKLGMEHIDLVAPLTDLARLHEAIGRTGDAAGDLDRVRRSVRNHVTRVLPVLGARGQLAFVNRIDRDLFHTALSLGLIHARDPALAERSASWLINGKAEVLEPMAEHARLKCDARDPKLTQKIERLIAVRTELAELSRTPSGSAGEADDQRRQFKHASEERRMAREVYSAAGRPVPRSLWIDAPTIRKALAHDAVFVDIARFRPYNFAAKGDDDPWQPARYVAWVLPTAGQGDARVVDLGPADVIDRAIAQARETIEQPGRVDPAIDEQATERAARTALQELARLVLMPLVPAFGDAHELVLCPDSKLIAVPWAALPVTDEQYAVERWQLRYVTTGRDLALSDAPARNRPPPAPSRIFAEPGRDGGAATDYESQDKSDDSQIDGNQSDESETANSEATNSEATNSETDSEKVSAPEPAEQQPLPRLRSRMMLFEGLENTACGIDSLRCAVESLANQPPAICQGNEVRQAALLSVASPRVLVLSMDGYYLHMEGMAGAARGALTKLETQPHGDIAWDDDDQTLENPFSRSGLNVVAADNEPGSSQVSGIEIAGCDLRGTELVILGACEPGLGPAQQDDFAELLLEAAGGDDKPQRAGDFERACDLRQAFQLAGARAVLSAQWRMPEADTTEIMSEFFRHLAAGDGAAASLRAAQLSHISARRGERHAAHPFFWAALRITGN